jgi:hypothetical protein
MTAGPGMTTRFGTTPLGMAARFGMPALAAEAATRRSDAIAAAPTAVVVATGLIITSHIAPTGIAVVSGPADADGAGCKNREGGTGDDSALPRRREMAHFSSASSWVY